MIPPIISIILLVIFYLVMPAVMVWICNKNKWLNKIGVILLLYVLGIIVGNIGILPEGHENIQKIMSESIIPLAIPFLLFGCDFRKFSIKKSLLALVIGVLSVLVVTVLGFWLFKGFLGTEGVEIGASLAGKCTGGTVNLIAIKMMLGISDSNFVLMNTYDMIVCFFYFIFLMSIGIKLSRKFIGGKKYKEQEVQINEYANNRPYADFGKKKNIIQILKTFGASALITGCSLGVSKLVGEEYTMIVLILTLTTLSLLASLTKEVRSWDKSYDAGMYLVFIFSIVVASMADLSTFNIETIYLLLYQFLIVFGSLLITILLAKLVKLDSDLAVMTSNTLINSPVFVPMIAASMKNKDVVISGISIGLVGFAIGNYIGLFMFKLLELF